MPQTTVERATRRVPARGSVRDPRSEPPRGRRRSRLSSGISASSGRRIRRQRRLAANIERIWSPLGDRHDREPCRSAFDKRPGIPRDPRCSDEARGCLPCIRMRTCFPWSSVGQSISASRVATVTHRAMAYAVLGFIAGPRFGDYQAGFRFGRLGYELVEKRGLKRFQARIYLNFGSLVMSWTRHVREGRDLLRRAFETANQSGDLNFAAYCYAHLNTNLLAAGDPLDDVQRRGRAWSRVCAEHAVRSCD